jgi:hypothetical protein
MRPELRQVLINIASTLSDIEGSRGARTHPDGTAREGSERLSVRLAERRARREKERRLSWSDLLLEAVSQAAAAPEDSDALEKALMRVGALTAAWLEDLRARRTAREQSKDPPRPGTILNVRLPPRSLVYRAVVRPDGQLHIPVLARVVSFNEVQVQRKPAPSKPPPPGREPLRAQVNTQLDAIRKRKPDEPPK